MQWGFSQSGWPILWVLNRLAEVTPNAGRLGAAKGFFLCLGLLTLYRVLCLFQPHLVLFYDEAYYYHWSLDLDWGYYSKPPVVAWVIAFFTSVFGAASVAVKLGAPILYAGAAIFVYRIAENLAGSRAACFSGWVFLTSILVGYNSLFITTDAPLLFFWAATLWAFVKTQDSNNRQSNLGFWWLTGLFCGLGMLSKYTMGALPLSLFLFLLSSENGRSQLRTPGPWIAAVFAGVIFSTNILWNILNEFVAYRHTSEISGVDSNWFNPDKLLEFVGAQFLVFGPVWAWLLLRRAWDEKGGKVRSPKILWFAIIPLFSVICIQALLSHAFVNWAGPIFVSASVLVGISLAARQDRLWIWAGGLNLLLLSLFSHWPVIADTVGLERDKSIDPYFRVLGWDQVAEEVAPILEDENLLLLSDSRKLLAVIGFYATPGEFRLARWSEDPDNIRDYYDLRVNLRDFQFDAEQEFLWVSELPAEQEIISAFESSEGLGSIEVPVYHNLAQKIYLYRLKGFFGYPEREGQE